MSKKPIPVITLEARVSIIGDEAGEAMRHGLCAHWKDDKFRYHMWIRTNPIKLDDIIHKNPLDLKASGHKALNANAQVHDVVVEELNRIVTKNNVDKAYAEAEAVERQRLQTEKRARATRFRVVIEEAAEDVLPAHLKAEIAAFSDDQILRFAAIVRGA
jgi:hypothetical protein